jgi:hypothetical protein
MVWVVTTVYQNGNEKINCICENEDKAKLEKLFLEKTAKDFKIDGDIKSIEIQDWIVL